MIEKLKKHWKQILVYVITIVICTSIGAYGAIILDATEVSYNKAGNTILVNEALDELYAIANSTPTSTSGTIPSGTYTSGQEIVYNGTGFEALTPENASNTERFFVIGDDGTSVRLLAKYCLNQAGTEQVNDGYLIYSRSFSSTNYWSSDFTSSPFDLQGDYLANHPLASTETVANNAIKAAQAYGTDKGATGRLMNYDEADTIINGSDQTMINILYGIWTGEDATEGSCLTFWLGAARDSGGGVWCVNGLSGKMMWRWLGLWRV